MSNIQHIRATKVRRGAADCYEDNLLMQHKSINFTHEQTLGGPMLRTEQTTHGPRFTSC